MSALQTRPDPKAVRLKVVCLECGKRWQTSNVMPECPRCGSVDIDPREG